eukprot:CAMPEP_0171110460 /NCGR_PEP_ID=MMETSP0766_2-20121228/71363_1 /TAXON_ID=439317 /ORGANISM="Gambierdiscus australes, Strain CAWD 149" /LENGTH=69 /DNA_ID=CAMNT_0011572329 /DNA_START=1 /DNA_END=208 /DNA_ORIENTATION=-
MRRATTKVAKADRQATTTVELVATTFQVRATVFQPQVLYEGEAAVAANHLFKAALVSSDGQHASPWWSS